MKGRNVVKMLKVKSGPNNEARISAAVFVSQKGQAAADSAPDNKPIDIRYFTSDYLFRLLLALG